MEEIDTRKIEFWKDAPTYTKNMKYVPKFLDAQHVVDSDKYNL